MVNLDYADAAGKLASGEIDALFCTAGIRTAVIEELAKECDLRLLSIDDTCLENCLQPQRNTANMSFLQTLTVDRTKT